MNPAHPLSSITIGLSDEQILNFDFDLNSYFVVAKETYYSRFIKINLCAIKNKYKCDL